VSRDISADARTVSGGNSVKEKTADSESSFTRGLIFFTNALDDRFYELERLFGEEGSRLAAESHGAAIDFIEQTVRDETIDCEFERLHGYLIMKIIVVFCMFLIQPAPALQSAPPSRQQQKRRKPHAGANTLQNQRDWRAGTV
jgi:hypothetical protein